MFKTWLIAAAVVSGTFLVLTAARGEDLPKFSTVGEAVGWVKAKAKCKGNAPRCKIRIDLPNEKRVGSGEWGVWAWLESSKFAYRFSVSIIRSGYSYLSPDAAVRVRIVKMSQYFFDKNGKLTETQVGFTIENFKGEVILDFQIPTQSHMHSEGAGDTIIFSQLGIGWKY